MKKIKLTPEEEMKLDMLRDSIQRYENLLAWQKLRRAEKKLLEIRLRYDYRSWRREYLLDKFLVTLRPKRRKDDG
jgi:phage-related protein|tara:strand:- start:2873 stop:3097 length:225 start_codon:yes stop_codon:yes gene_type:complete